MKYDLIMVFAPDSQEKEIMQKITALLEKEGYSVSEPSWWGKKHLAYPLKKFSEGNYASFIINAKAGTPHKLAKIFKLEENILRHLVLKKREKKGVRV